MGTNIQISVASPCQEKWSAMTPGEKGRFCGACQKEVVDFSHMSDQQLIAFFAKRKESVCGRFYNDQLDRSLLLRKKKSSWLKYFFYVTIPAFFFVNRGRSQGGTAVRQKADTLISPVIKTLPGTGESKQIADTVKPLTISGRIVNEDGEGVAYASIIIEGTNKGAMADSSGYFSINNKGLGNLANLTFSAVGYPLTSRVVNFLNSEVLNIVLAYPKDYITMGIVITTPRRIKEIPLPKETVNMIVYPNPLPAGAPLTINIDKWKEGYYELIVANNGGAIVYQRKVWIDKDARLLDVQLPILSQGTYLINLSGKGRKDQYFSKIVVQ